MESPWFSLTTANLSLIRWFILSHAWCLDVELSLNLLTTIIFLVLILKPRLRKYSVLISLLIFLLSHRTSLNCPNIGTFLLIKDPLKKLFILGRIQVLNTSLKFWPKKDSSAVTCILEDRMPFLLTKLPAFKKYLHFYLRQSTKSWNLRLRTMAKLMIQSKDCM